MNDLYFFKQLVLKFAEVDCRFVGKDEKLAESIVNKALEVFKQTEKAIEENHIGYFEVKGADLVKELRNHTFRKGGITPFDDDQQDN